MGTFSFVLLLLGFSAVLYWYYINEFYKDDNGSTSFLGVITNLDDADKYALKNLFNQRTGKFIYQRKKRNDEALKRKRDRGSEQNNNEKDYKKTTNTQNEQKIDDLKKENQDREEKNKRNLKSKFYRYTDNNMEKKYKSIPKTIRKIRLQEKPEKVGKKR